jgi:serine protease inhibitor
MRKNYTTTPNLLVSLLVLLSFNFTGLAQSKSGKNSAHTTVLPRRASVEHVSTLRSGAPTTQATTTVTACNNYTWPVNGVNYTVSGIYTSGGGITQIFNNLTAWNNSAAANGATVATDNMAGIPAATVIDVTIGTTDLSLTSPNGMYSNGAFIGANNSGDAVTITFNPPIYGIAGNYFNTDISDNEVSGNITLTYSTGAVDSRTVATAAETFGYFSTTPISSLVLSSTSTGIFVSLENLSIATNPSSSDVLDLTIITPTTPTFPPVAAICSGTPLSALPTTSNNGISGTWSPALDNTNTTVYTFTPNVGECATVTTKTITVYPIGSNSTSVTACNSYTWPIDGVTYTASGSYLTTIPLTDIAVVDDFSLWLAHAFSFNATVDFDDLSNIAATNPTNFILGTTNVSMSAPGGMYSSGDFLGTGNPNNPMTITFTPPVYGVSANYFTTDINDNVISGNVTVTYSNGHVESRTVTSDTDTFGYFDNSFISSIVISSSTTVPNRYISVKNLAIATNPTSCSTETLNLTINTLPPPGDTMATAIDVNTPTYATTGNNLELNCYTDTIGTAAPDVWYKVTLDGCAQALSLDTCVGSNYDTLIRVFAADGVTELDSSDDDCGTTFQSSISDLDVSAEDVVYVVVEGYFGLGTEQGTYGLNITQTLSTPTVTTFTPVAAICSGDTLAPLPTTSIEGIEGTWSPALDNTATTTYTFTPNSDQCGTTATMTITVNQPTIVPTFTAVAPICNGATLAALPTTSNNGYTGNWSPALNNTTTTVYTFTPTAGQCATTATLTITVNQPVLPTFTAVPAICNGDTLSPLPTSSNNGFTGTWSPVLNNTATTIYTFTPTAGQCASTATLTITVNQPVTPTFTAVAAICNGDSLSPLPTISNNGFTGNWSPALNNTTTTIYTFTPTAGQCASSTTLTITVNQPVTPTFTAVADICNGDSLSPLPTISNNGFTGSWSPALNNTATTIYTFTPTAGQCASSTTLTITVNQPVTPTFTAIAAICNGDALTLPTTSNNGFTGTWSPAFNNTATTTYTFTPTAGQCALTTTMTITVNQPVTPTFTAVAAICSGNTLSALPTTSNNGVTGTWLPAINNTTTTTYTFTPNTGECASTATLTITVNQPVTPTFTIIAAICNGDALTLPTTSNNGFTGTWSPAFSNTATATYTFTPDSGQCATTATLTITVNQPVTPTFTAIAAICNGDTLTLPATSNNGIIGTWSPALNNTATTTYTFTPNSGQCATTASLTITVNQLTTPSFTPVPSICVGEPLSPLPTTSNNGITGTWSPALDNTTTTIYTFTPDAGQCAAATTLTIDVNLPTTIPTFTAIAPICNGDTLVLPTISNNGIVGTWSPVFDNSLTGTYTFTPNPGQCGISTTLTVTVNQPVTPTFNAVPAICSGDALAALPTTSNNGISGTWSPALDNTATTVYTFTPNSGQCTSTLVLSITVNQPVIPTFTAVPAICNGDALTALPTTSNNGISGTWSPALDNTVTTTYTFTPDSGQCASTATLTITVNQPVIPTFTAVTAICSGDVLAALPTTSNNGISGTWSPALDNTATTTYTFTPDAGQCAAVPTIIVTVNQPVIPTFTAVAAICNGDALAALPTTSDNGISGTWSPALDNTATTTYTFTSDAGQCAAATATLTITVNQPITPTFTAVAAICSGDALAALPTTSNNGISGTWSPALDNTATTTYTFTSDAGQCALAMTTLTITVNQPITPAFTAVAAICSGDALAALPTTSNNGISGTWSPALDNTATTTYTFTPDAGQCAAATATLTITVNQLVAPTFNAVTAICSGDALAPLPTTSNNGISGTWSPALDNTATTTYTFTPDAGQCAAVTTIIVTVNQPVIPTFTPVATICNGDALAPLPTTSNNGISGTWSPALDNTATTTYTFTPDADQCASTTTLIINVNTLTPTPTGLATQTFNVADLNDATVADLIIDPSNTVIWFGSLADAQSLSNPLSLTTVLANGSIYYAVNIIATCPSAPFAVTVTITLGNNEFDDLHFVYYPNPTSSVVNISYSRNITQVTLINMLGQVISTETTDSTQVQVDLSRLAEATYFIRVVADEKEKVIKIIKQR